MPDGYDLEEGDTCYYNGEEHDVVRGYNGVNMVISQPGENNLLVDPRAVTHPENYEPPEEPEPEPDVDSEPEGGDEEGDEPEADVDEEPVEVAADVTTITGVGEDYAEELREAGYETVDDVLEAAPEQLAADTDIGEGQARRFHENAQDV